MSLAMFKKLSFFLVYVALVSISCSKKEEIATEYCNLKTVFFGVGSVHSEYSFDGDKIAQINYNFGEKDSLGAKGYKSTKKFSYDQKGKIKGWSMQSGTGTSDVTYTEMENFFDGTGKVNSFKIISYQMKDNNRLIMDSLLVNLTYRMTTVIKSVSGHYKFTSGQSPMLAYQITRDFDYDNALNPIKERVEIRTDTVTTRYNVRYEFDNSPLVSPYISLNYNPYDLMDFAKNNVTLREVSDLQSNILEKNKYSYSHNAKGMAVEKKWIAEDGVTVLKNMLFEYSGCK